MESEKQKLSEVMEQHGIQWIKLGTHRKHLSVLNFEKQEREKEVQQLDKTIEEAARKIQSGEKQVRTKQSEIKQAEKELAMLSSSRLKVNKNIQIYQSGKEWQLPEPAAFTSVKAYKEKKVEPLVAKLKDVIQTVLIHNLDLNRKLETVTNRLEQIRQQVKRLEGRLMLMEQENSDLKEQNRDLKQLQRALGEDKVISILERQKAAESPDNSLKRRKGMER